jgi:hypothetical protein
MGCGSSKQLDAQEFGAAELANTEYTRDLPGVIHYDFDPPELTNHGPYPENGSDIEKGIWLYEDNLRRSYGSLRHS